MHIIKRHVFVLFLAAATLRGVDFPETRRSEKEPFPRPADGVISEVNPPAFVWLPVKDAGRYRFSMTGMTDPGEQVLTIEKLKQTCFIHNETFESGTYTWTVEAFDDNGHCIAKRRPYELTVPANAVRFPFPDIEKLASDIGPHHPRFIFDRYEIEQVRRTLTTTRKHGWLAVKKMADSSLYLDKPLPPWYGPIEDYRTRRLEYRRYYRYIRKFIDKGMQSLALAWLMTGEQKYADKAKELLFVVVEWDPHGITSSNKIGFDEPGLSLARCMHRVYDWLYGALTEQEREIVRTNLIERARDTWDRVGVNRPFMQNPGSSHDGRLIGYLGEQALVLAGEAADEEVRKWLDFSLKAFWTVFPHWAGSGGGWAEGIGYAAAYNIRATTWIECFMTAGLDLWRKPFFQKIRNYFLYCARPNDEFWAFGDGAERGPRLNPSRAVILRSLMAHYAQRFDDPACQWWAGQVPLDAGEISNPVIPLILAKETKGKPPAGRPNAAVFKDVGWVATHSDLSDPENDVFFLFKSSPFGSVSHSHADQNAFYLSVGGRALAIPSGYYGPVYGMPHHADWTRSSKANNTILVNGEGQVVRDFTAAGSITGFIDTERMTFFCGDAAPAYKGALKKFERHVLYIRPGFFVIFDDLEAPGPSTFQWMLHALDEMSINGGTHTIKIQRSGALAEIFLFSSGGPLQLSQTDQFDTPYNAGTDSSYHVHVDNHWHLTAAATEKHTRKRFAAFLHAGAGALPPVAFEQKDGWQKASLKTQDGVAEIWAQLDADAPLPDALRGIVKDGPEKVVVAGVLRLDSGEVQILTNSTKGRL